MNLDECLAHALYGLAAAYYENINYEPKYAKRFCLVYDQADEMGMEVSQYKSDYEELKGI